MVKEILEPVREEHNSTGRSTNLVRRFVIGAWRPSVHQAGLEATLFQPAHDLVFGEADIRFDPQCGISPRCTYARVQFLLKLAIQRRDMPPSNMMSSTFCFGVPKRHPAAHTAKPNGGAAIKWGQ